MLLTDVAQWKPSGDSEPVTIIIGAGAIGLYAASELAKCGKRVLVVESGGTHLGGFAAESFSSIGVPHDGISVARSRSLGGTTNLWGGQLVEFQPADFNGRDWMPGSAWPVRYDEISPYYRKAYDNLGLQRETHDDDVVWKSVSAERPQIGDEFEVFLTRWLKIPSFAIMFAKLYETSEKFSVLTGYTVIGFEGSSERITGVRVVDLAGNRYTIAGETFILAAGTIENSRLLLQAAADESWPCPWRQNQNIGKYFLDHLGCKAATVKPHDTRKFFDTFSTIWKSGHKYQPKFRLRNDVLLRDPILNVQGLFGFESSVSENLVYLKQFVKAAVYSRKIENVGDVFKNVAACSKYLVPLMWRYVRDHRVFVPSASKISLLIQAEQAPLAESCIRLDRSVTDAYGLHRVTLDWRLSGNEQASIAEFTRRADAALQHAGLATLEIEPGLNAMDPNFMVNVKDTYHQAGGTVMGVSEGDGVVDRNLKVFGSANLYVGGASIFRTVSNANTTFTALAFTTRLVEHLCK
ncbi:MAG TPA: GMC oxidoreductase [Candidatus Saccharimonadales bacterium]|jgi:choline dehydrogenase-like flavoprotein|nr:GMC oxidoreductase [Candidatus Saccharimonadales bacterium]